MNSVTMSFIVNLDTADLALTDPFGHGFCLVQFSAEGYDALAE